MNRPPDDLLLPAGLGEAVRRVREDREHGASWLSREAARALAAASRPEDAKDTSARLDALHAAAQSFAAARPSMAAVANTAARIWAAAATAAGTPTATPPAKRLAAAHDAAEVLLRTWDDASTAISRTARSLLHGAIFTHSRSGTVEAVLRLLAADDGEANGKLHAIVTESRPGGEGLALARSLAGAGWHVTIIADAACGYFMPDAGVVILGADSVRADGSLINKIGSYLVALAAREAHVPVCVLCETIKIAAPGLPLVFEEMDPSELLPAVVAVPHVTARNVYFDRTPADLITAVITERGVLTREQIRRVADEAAHALATLHGTRPSADS